MGFFSLAAVSALGTSLETSKCSRETTNHFIATLAQAQLATYCPIDQVCYRVNIPASSASSGTGDIFFQIQAPSTYQWVGLGQGAQMKGSNIFIIYSDAENTNVTLSPRLGKGEFEPEYDSAANVTLIDGTGIANGMMTANVRCKLRNTANRATAKDSMTDLQLGANCETWDGGSMSLTDKKSNWIWSVKNGDPLAQNQQDAELQMHDKNDAFTLDLTVGTGGDSLNPFVQSANTTAPAGNTTSGSSPAGSAPTGSSAGTAASGAEASYNRKTLAHGFLMSFAFL